jgi:uncharacterized membrane protein
MLVMLSVRRFVCEFFCFCMFRVCVVCYGVFKSGLCVVALCLGVIGVLMSWQDRGWHQ